MVINSLFIINTNESKIFMEKHWCAAVSYNFVLRVACLASVESL